jgi:hypothetical protein
MANVGRIQHRNRSYEGGPTMNPEPEVTVRDYRFTCSSCGHDLRGAPWLDRKREARCPECGQVNLRDAAMERWAAQHDCCCRCWHALDPAQQFVVLPGSGVIVCPECKRLHLELTGIYLNDRGCKRKVKCEHCGHDLFGVMALPASKAFRCPACGSWSAYLCNDQPAANGHQSHKGSQRSARWRAAFSERMSSDEARVLVGDESPWNILGLIHGASRAEIKLAWRKMAMKWHPDHNKGNEKQATEQFKRCKAAYLALRGRG